MERPKKEKEAIKKIKQDLAKPNIEELDPEELLERSYYENSIIIKVKGQFIDDIATCFDIDDTMQYLMLAPLEFIGRTDGIEGEKEFKERLWKQVRVFYKAARDLLDKRYRL